MKINDLYGIESSSKKFGSYIALNLFNVIKPNKKLNKKFTYEKFAKTLTQSHVIGGLEVLQMLLTIQKDIDASEKDSEKFDLLKGEIEIMTNIAVRITDKWDLKKANRNFDIPELREGYKYWSLKIMEEDDKKTITH